LETDEDCSRHFPVEVITSDYVTDSASIRDTRARNVTVKVGKKWSFYIIMSVSLGTAFL